MAIQFSPPFSRGGDYGFLLSPHHVPLTTVGATIHHHRYWCCDMSFWPRSCAYLPFETDADSRTGATRRVYGDVTCRDFLPAHTLLPIFSTPFPFPSPSIISAHSSLRPPTMEATEIPLTRTAARVLCPLCGLSMESNPANRCGNCVRSQVNLQADIAPVGPFDSV